MSEAVDGRRRLSRRERRDLGLLPRNLFAKAAGLAKDGLLDTDHALAAIQIAEMVVDENPSAFKAAAGDNPESFLDAIIEFIERMMPLIMKLLSLFGLL